MAFAMASQRSSLVRATVQHHESGHPLQSERTDENISLPMTIRNREPTSLRLGRTTIQLSHLGGSARPVLRHYATQRIIVLSEIPKVRGAKRQDLPWETAPTVRVPRSSEKARSMMAGFLHQP